MLSEEKAKRVKKFIERQKYGKGIYARKPFILQDYQYNKIIKSLYGTINTDGSRQYRTCLIVKRWNGDKYSFL